MKKEKLKKDLDLILSQKNPESRQIMIDFLNSNLKYNKQCIDYLLYYTDKPNKQKRVIKYSKNYDIVDEEYFMITMVGIEDEYVEEQLFSCFNDNKIRSIDDFLDYKHSYQKKSSNKLIKVLD